MEDKFKSTEFFISDNPEEIEKEKKKRQALHSFFPHSMGSEDNTRYVLLGNNKSEPKVNNPFEQPKQESSNVKSTPDFGNDEKELNFDPWQREKTLDRMRVIKYPNLNGE